MRSGSQRRVFATDKRLREPSRRKWLVRSRRREKRCILRRLTSRATSLRRLEEEQDALKTVLASSSQKQPSALASFIEHTAMRGVIGTLFDIGLALHSSKFSRAVHSVLGRSLEDTVVVESREVDASLHCHSGSRGARQCLPTPSQRTYPLHHSLGAVCEAPRRSQRTETSRRLRDLQTCLPCCRREAAGLVAPRRLLPGSSCFPARQRLAMELRDSRRRIVLDERRGANAAIVEKGTLCDVDSRSCDSPARRVLR